MSAENEPAKLLLPYLQRADELQKHEPLVAYYCRLYAMERGLKIPQSNRTKTTNALLVSLMKQLEKDKKSLKLGPDDHLHVEGFAQNVFAKADKQDRAGRADLNTAKTFYAASIFFEILNQFGEVDPELEQKQKYAVWKAADIRRALKEGRTPQPGPPGGDKDMSVPSSISNTEYDLEQSNSESTIRYNPSESSAAVTPDSHALPGSYDQNANSHTVLDSYDDINSQHHPIISRQPSNITHSPSVDVSSPHSYPSNNYPSQTFHQNQSPPPINPQHSAYSQPYDHQPYQPEPHQQFPQQYPSHDAPSYSYPNFQSYPSFTESSLPSAPSHSPTYYQSVDADPPRSNLAPYTASSAHYDSQDLPSSKKQSYEYDSNYQPPPEKISEAHKAARFAVGALAFDDVATAVEHLKKSLELLTNPSAAN